MAGFWYEMKRISLTKGKVALVDNEDFERLSKYSWYAHQSEPHRYYAATREKKTGKFLYMHRLIMDIPSNLFIDHINGNRLDNRKSNLRMCTKSQNTLNKRLSKRNTSGYKGVSWSNTNQGWYSCIRNKGKTIPLGYYDDPIDAAKAHDKAAIKLFGEFAMTNEQMGLFNA